MRGRTKANYFCIKMNSHDSPSNVSFIVGGWVGGGGGDGESQDSVKVNMMLNVHRNHKAY